jgi:hypothetical protein
VTAASSGGVLMWRIGDGRPARAPTTLTAMTSRRRSQLHHTAISKVLGDVLGTQPRPSGGWLEQWHAAPHGTARAARLAPIMVSCNAGRRGLRRWTSGPATVQMHATTSEAHRPDALIRPA